MCWNIVIIASQYSNTDCVSTGQFFIHCNKVLLSIQTMTVFVLDIVFVCDYILAEFPPSIPTQISWYIVSVTPRYWDSGCIYTLMYLPPSIQTLIMLIHCHNYPQVFRHWYRPCLYRALFLYIVMRCSQVFSQWLCLYRTLFLYIVVR